MRVLIPLLIVAAIFTLPLLIFAVADRKLQPSKGGRERFVWRSWDPRCWVGAHGPTLVMRDTDDCRVWRVRCDSCNYGWAESENSRAYRRLLRFVMPCGRDDCACKTETAPDWGTPS